MWFGVISLFPEMLKAVTESGVTSRAVKHGLIDINVWNPRDFTLDKYQTVDDRPYGGGPGMLMKVQPLRDAISAARQQAPQGTKVVYMSPQGERLSHSLVTRFHNWGSLILIAGRYEGIDERILQKEVDLEVSIGDYVLSGGEIPAMCVIDAVSRMVPGVLGDIRNAHEDSFADGLLHFPQYTRPEVIDGMAVPEVLMSGNHEKIRRWRLQQALSRTYERRPDLLQSRLLNREEQKLLDEYLEQKKLED
ncbi:MULTISPECIES: tRNA (guanosine(37)-N1)-methyltransferase TrmD [unclassified Anaerobiospirillum]|uniref:tRNA (guanosine(37)-N1)-methyltransferase TrmD n=1 Tax=unclassified Anaerobiospirillum TaxID=2647410 RepID=UPI001FF4EE78|nr:MULTISPECIES: tRNA (guanosine(37)-N1)-methyltransferase TrmD [unclassified Anaerobiospirillum]MCK0526292.1 tRNA (guanosine(37)-N1)-methyltransferase TrmD [Anaerobiospirillum sp. NML120449]MCK0535308.1 tRNA (guanosine(37)-N1)-methyltransferase TrmD [Anaerobiospirillum sp. NML120511]MCK0540497.1 tRNA (guanosine(37)-N1)-methyltransferase TrmD [Anaerobiospirillum sp. NML02-A-032]